MENTNMYQCPKCNAEFTAGTKFCQNCGCNLEIEFIKTPTCPKCRKVFATGTKFCDEDGTKLVSPEKLVPRCVKCGQTYTEGTKFCPDDGGQVLITTHTNSKSNEFLETPNQIFYKEIKPQTTDDDDNFVDRIVTSAKKWHGFVIGWAIFALVVNTITFINSIGSIGLFIQGLQYIANWTFYEYVAALLLICPIVIISGIVKLLQREKSGFTLLVVATIAVACCNIYLDAIPSAVFGLLSIGIWYAILQIKKNGITAWSTLE